MGNNHQTEEKSGNYIARSQERESPGSPLIRTLGFHGRGPDSTSHVAGEKKKIQGNMYVKEEMLNYIECSSEPGKSL